MPSDEGTRYTVDELVTLHNLERDFVEVLVEGRTDAAVVAWFLHVADEDAEVYPLSERVQVDLELDDYADIGTRSRVLATAALIAQDRWACANITCVVDADYWRSLEELPDFPECLLATDYSSLEMYCFNEQTMRKFLHVVLRAPRTTSPSRILAAIEQALIQLFAIRWILKGLPEPIGLIAKIEKRFSVTTSSLQLDAASLIQDSLTSAGIKNARRIAIEEMVPAYEEVLKKVASLDPRHAINGHDFCRALCHFIIKAHPSFVRDDRSGFKDFNTTNAALLGCLDYNALGNESMFATLLARVRRVTSSSSEHN